MASLSIRALFPRPPQPITAAPKSASFRIARRISSISTRQQQSPSEHSSLSPGISSRDPVVLRRPLYLQGIGSVRSLCSGNAGKFSVRVCRKVCWIEALAVHRFHGVVPRAMLSTGSYRLNSSALRASHHLGGKVDLQERISKQEEEADELEDLMKSQEEENAELQQQSLKELETSRSTENYRRPKFRRVDNTKGPHRLVAAQELVDEENDLSDDDDLSESEMSETDEDTGERGELEDDSDDSDIEALVKRDESDSDASTLVEDDTSTDETDEDLDLADIHGSGEDSVHEEDDTDSDLEPTVDDSDLESTPKDRKSLGKLLENKLDEGAGLEVYHKRMETTSAAWSSFLSHLRKNNYYEIEEGVLLLEGDEAYLKPNYIKRAVMNLGRDRDDIFQLFASEDLKVLADIACPSTDRKVVNAGKRLRAHFKISEATICQPCKVRSQCERAYAAADTPAGTSDVMRYLLEFGLALSDKECRISEQVQASLINLWNQAVLLTNKPRNPNLPKHPNKGATKEINHKKKMRFATMTLEESDWRCPECNFPNFSRNRYCRECNSARPPLELRPGDWECLKCRFINYSRNDVCKDCKAERPRGSRSDNRSLESDRGVSRGREPDHGGRMVRGLDSSCGREPDHGGRMGRGLDSSRGGKSIRPKHEEWKPELSADMSDDLTDDLSELSDDDEFDIDDLDSDDEFAKSGKKSTYLISDEDEKKGRTGAAKGRKTSKMHLSDDDDDFDDEDDDDSDSDEDYSSKSVKTYAGRSTNDGEISSRRGKPGGLYQSNNDRAPSRNSRGRGGRLSSKDDMMDDDLDDESFGLKSKNRRYDDSDEDSISNRGRSGPGRGRDDRGQNRGGRFARNHDFLANSRGGDDDFRPGRNGSRGDFSDDDFRPSRGGRSSRGRNFGDNRSGRGDFSDDDFRPSRGGRSSRGRNFAGNRSGRGDSSDDDFRPSRGGRGSRGRGDFRPSRGGGGMRERDFSDDDFSSNGRGGRRGREFGDEDRGSFGRRGYEGGGGYEGRGGGRRGGSSGGRGGFEGGRRGRGSGRGRGRREDSF